jgi:hypothetical protein
MANKGSASSRSAMGTAIQASTSRRLSPGAQEERTTCPRYLHAIVLPWLGLSIFADGGCASSSPADGYSSCPPPYDLALVNLGCVPSVPPVVKTTGPCTVSSGVNAQDVYLQGNDAGTCHVEITFGSGVTSSVDVDFMSFWRPLGSDPRGCGQEFAAVTESGSPQVSVPEPVCDAGLYPFD